MLKEFLVGICDKQGENCSDCPAYELCNLFPVKFASVSKYLLTLATRDYLRAYCDARETCYGCMCRNACDNCIGGAKIPEFSELSDGELINFLGEIFSQESEDKQKEEKQEPKEDKSDTPEVTAQEVWEFMKEYILNSDEINMGIYPEMVGQVNAKSFFEIYSPEEAIRRWRMYKEEEKKKEFQPYEVILVDGRGCVFMRYTNPEKTQIEVRYKTEYDVLFTNFFIIENHCIKRTGIVAKNLDALGL